MKTTLLFGIHCHQPVENFYNIVDNAFYSCYKPFIETCFGFEKFRFSVHFSGWLLDYIKEHFKETFGLLKKMVERGQIEFFSGGYYEPILSSITSEDRRLQVNKLNKYIYNNFGFKPKGIWLTERVWDSSIVPDLVNEGIEYITVDDYHFLSNGYKPNDMFDYYITEQDGLPLKIFPIDKSLRYMIPFKQVEDVMNYLKTLTNVGSSLAIIFDDGEKFGVWPGTNDWVYNQGWLKKFLETVCNDNNIEISNFIDVAKAKKPKDITYLPTTSYMEMGEWSLFTDAYELMDELFDFLAKSGLKDKFFYLIKGGIWKNFFAKYPESNHLHKRIMNLSKAIDEIDNNKKMKEAIIKAECNDVFWHGIFGGIYLPNLRNNAYRFLIEAEKIYDEAMNNKNVTIDIKDLNMDGYEEAVLKNDNLIAIFSSKYYGQLQEFDIKNLGFNLQNTIARRKESYHKAILTYAAGTQEKKEGITTIHEMGISATEDAKKNIIYDWYNRYSFIDHFTERFLLDEFIQMSFSELGDFVKSHADAIKEKKSIIFKRDGNINIDGKSSKLTVIKTYRLEDVKLKTDIEISSELDQKLFYVLEFNFHFYNFQNLTINGINARETNSCKANIFKFSDGVIKNNIIIEFENEVEIYWHFIKTVSQSERGVDLTNQGICVLVPIDFIKKLNINNICLGYN